MTGKKPKRNEEYSARLIAFIDILGFSSLVQRTSREPDLLINLLKALRTIENYSFRGLHESGVSDVIDDIYKKRQMIKALRDHMTAELAEMTGAIFSDSIILTASCTPDGFRNILSTIVHLTLSLLKLNVFVRGGLVRGDLYSEGSIILGPGVISAYELERDIAVYPRVVMPNYVPGIVDLFGILLREAQASRANLKVIRTTKSCIARDRDGTYFVDFLSRAAVEGRHKSRHVRFLEIRKIILSNYLQHRSRDDEMGAKIKTKMIWLVDYFNATLESHPSLNVRPIVVD